MKFVLLNNDESAICLPFYERICEKNYQTNSSGVTEGLHIVDVEHPDGVVSLVGELIDQDYKKFFATLTCGSLSSPVELVPSPRAVHKLVRDFEVTEGIFSGTISILGFMKPADLSHAPIVARHLVIAVSKGEQTK